MNETFQNKWPVVRLGPNEVFVSTIDGGIRTVLGGGFAKTQWYEFFTNHGLVNNVLGPTYGAADVST